VAGEKQLKYVGQVSNRPRELDWIYNVEDDMMRFPHKTPEIILEDA